MDWNAEVSLQDRIFQYTLSCLQKAAQLRVNHWQTESYAEHKATDEMISEIYSFVDELGESTLGEFGRPKIKTTHLTVSDYATTSTKWVLESLKTETKEILDHIKVTEFEGLLSLVGDFDAVLKKYLYLITLG